MTWVKLDDNFADHPKVRHRTDQAYRLYVDLLVYCGRYNTDGNLTFADVEAHRYAEYAVELVGAGLWVETDTGFEVYGFLERNPSRAQVEAERAKARERQSRRRSQGKSRRDITSDSRVMSHDPDPTRPEGSRDGESVAVVSSFDPDAEPEEWDVKANVERMQIAWQALKAVEAS